MSMDVSVIAENGVCDTAVVEVTFGVSGQAG